MIKLIIAISLNHKDVLITTISTVPLSQILHSIPHTHTQLLEITYKIKPYSIPVFHEFCNSKKAHQLLYYHNNAAFQQAFHNTRHCTTVVGFFLKYI